MKLKNRCLYSELDGTGGDVPRGYAYLLIVGALEVYARVVSPGFRYPGVGTGYDDTDDTARRRVLSELEAFMSTERGESQVDRIDILASRARFSEVDAVAAEALLGKSN
jgi:hypothetical protein